MWTSNGRSGYGDSTIGGDYDSWDGVSPNGKQYKNEATMETRDLSGADYWHLRKQNRPTEEIPTELHMLKNGKANIAAYADFAPTKKTSIVNIKDRILPQAKRLTTLQAQMLELETEYKTTDMSIDEYTILRDVLVAKIQRQEVLYKKAINVRPVREDDTEILDDSSLSCEENTPESCANENGEDGHRVEDFEWISDENSLKKILQKACRFARKAVQFSKATRNYINELNAV